MGIILPIIFLFSDVRVAALEPRQDEANCASIINKIRYKSHSITSMYCSRMRTASLLTVSRGGGGEGSGRESALRDGVCIGGGQTPFPPCEQNDKQV